MVQLLILLEDNATDLFKIKQKIISETGNSGKKYVKLMVQLKYLNILK